MGNAKFYFTPQPYGLQNGVSLVTIDLGESLGEMYSDISIDAVDGVTLTGSIQRSIGRTQEIVTIQRDRMIGGEDLAIQFVALQNHLDRGYSVSFAADSDKAFCFPVKGSLQNNSSTINLYANPFQNFTGTSALPAVGDYCTIETGSPAMIQEVVKMQNVSNITAQGGNVNSVNPVRFQYDRLAFLRHYRFFPVLKRPQSDIGQSIITNEGGRLFSLSIRLIVDYVTYFVTHPEAISESGVSVGEQLAGSESGGDQGSGTSLDNLIGRIGTHVKHLDFLNGTGTVGDVNVGAVSPEKLGE